MSTSEVLLQRCSSRHPYPIRIHGPSLPSDTSRVHPYLHPGSIPTHSYIPGPTLPTPRVHPYPQLHPRSIPTYPQPHPRSTPTYPHPHPWSFPTPSHIHGPSLPTPSRFQGPSLPPAMSKVHFYRRGLVPAGSVSSSSTFRSFRDTSHS